MPKAPKKKRERIRCRKCNVELSFRELQSGGLVTFEGSPCADTGHMCFVCQRMEEEKTFGTQEDY